MFDLNLISDTLSLSKTAYTCNRKQMLYTAGGRCGSRKWCKYESVEESWLSRGDYKKEFMYVPQMREERRATCNSSNWRGPLNNQCLPRFGLVPHMGLQGSLARRSV